MFLELLGLHLVKNVGCLSIWIERANLYKSIPNLDISNIPKKAKNLK